jgi:prolyl oligopeptidase
MPLNISKSPVEEELHGVTVRDPYRWLEDRTLPETGEWIREQQSHCDSYFAACPDFDELQSRVREYLDVDIVDQPARVQGRYFYRKRKKSEEQGCLYVRRVGAGTEQILVDPAQEGPFTSVGIHCIADNGRLLAFEVRRGGEDRKEIRVLDPESGIVLPGSISRGYVRGFTFSSNNTGYLYAQDVPDSSDQHSIRLHRFGEERADEVVFQVPKCLGSRLVLMADSEILGAFWTRHSNGGRVADLWIAARTNTGRWTKVFANRPLPYRAFFWQNRIFAFSETACGKQQIVEVFADSEEVRVVVPDMDFPVRECAMIRDRIYLSRWVGNGSKIDVWEITGKQHASIDLPGEGTVELLPGFTQAPTDFFYTYESFDHAPSIYEYWEKGNASRLWWRRENRQQSHRFRVRKETFSSKDGVVIPVTLVGHEDAFNDRPSPVVMTSYGGFGYSMSPQFSVLSAILMELGVVLAIPHIRGGGEFGKSWHEAGRAVNRQKSFDDFIAAAEWLIEKRISNRDQLGIFGGSNAGLLVAAVMIQRPNLFQAVLCIAPLLDMIRYESFDQARKWRDEYGTIEDRDDFLALYSYSPYHRVAEGVDYPAMMFVTGDKDDRCNPAHVRKMAAALQNRISQVSPVIVDYSGARGHAPTLPLSTRITALGRRIAFLCRELSIDVPKGGIDVDLHS